MPGVDTGHISKPTTKNAPELVVHVATTISTVQDIELTETIHDELAERQLLPPSTSSTPATSHPQTSSGPSTCTASHSSARSAPTTAPRPRPVRASAKRPSRSRDNEQAICPRGATSVSWTKLNITDHTYLQARFADADCRPCPDRTQCTTSATGPRSIAVLPLPLHEIQMRNRLDQRTEQRVSKPVRSVVWPPA
ncbi:transposase [Streptomyces sp. NPDC020951]|uniref:transposase n=1 Tax=Streptomyces sp. NPDC020951 TaxID=3365104 RepID=UPI0037B3277F